MNDLTLVQRCLARDESAWRHFFQRFKPRIERRIRQVFARYGYKYADAQFLNAFDYVLDQLIFNRALEGYRHETSLDGFVLTVTARATIDWYRSSVAEKRLFGLVDNPETLDHEPAATEVASEVESPEFAFIKRLTPEDALIFRLLMLRSRDLSPDEIKLLARLSERNEHQTRQSVAALQAKLQEQNLEAEEQFGKLQTLFLQLQALRLRGAPETRIERRQKQYERLLAVYQKRGFEILPSRTELAELCRWDVNKIDRSLRKIRERLARVPISDETLLRRRSH